MKLTPGAFGLSKTSTYRIWDAMIRRCHKETAKEYKNYGARGIKVCDRWRQSFVAFLVDMGSRPDGLTLDRINVHGDYEPGNCRWASYKVQGRNKTNNRMISFAGQTLCVSEWEERLGLGSGVVGSRLLAGWSEEEALTRPHRLSLPTPERLAQLKARSDACKRAYDKSERGRERHRMAQRRYVQRLRQGQ